MTPAARPQPRHGRVLTAAWNRPLPDLLAADEELFASPFAAAVAATVAAAVAAIAAVPRQRHNGHGGDSGCGSGGGHGDVLGPGRGDDGRRAQRTREARTPSHRGRRQ